MIFTECKLEGAFIVDLERSEDNRGFFARTFCSEEFERHGLRLPSWQSSVSFNKRRGTLRGMHFQKAPHGETKLVRCQRGAIFDVIIDLRPTSESFKHWIGYELSAENGRALYVPQFFAHGFITLLDDTEVAYQMADPYVPAAATGVRWDDPAIAIEWPLAPSVISEKDANLEDISLEDLNLGDCGL